MNAPTPTVAIVGQAVRYDELLEDRGHRLHIFISSDSSYHFQSRAYIERWDGSQWQRLVDIPPTDLSNYPSYVARIPPSATDFAKDRLRLLAAARFVLGGA